MEFHILVLVRRLRVDEVLRFELLIVLFFCYVESWFGNDAEFSFWCRAFLFFFFLREAVSVC